LGNISNGQARSINEDLVKWQLLDRSEAVMAVDGSGRDDNIRERRLLSQLINQDAREVDGILFMGWSDSSPPLFKVTEPGGDGRNYGLMLLRQDIAVDYPAGEFTIPAGFIGARVGKAEGGLEKRPDGIIVHDGNAVLTYDLADILRGKKYSVSRMSFPTGAGGAISTVEVYNRNTNSWNELEGGRNEILAPEIANYLLPDGSVQVRITGRYRGGEAIKAGAFRGIEVEGVVE
jgi:hypothetical protein